MSHLESLLNVEPDNNKVAELLGCTPSAVGHWRRGSNGHSAMSEAAAKMALEKYQKADEPTPEPADGPLLIIEDSDRVRRLLAIARIEWIEV